jgi:hypothetical protein
MYWSNLYDERSEYVPILVHLASYLLHLHQGVAFLNISNSPLFRCVVSIYRI